MNQKEKLKEATINILSKESLFEMTNLTPRKTGLKVIIWSEQNGEDINKEDKLPGFKIEGKDFELSYSLEENPKELARSGKIKQSDEKNIKEAVQYISRNLDLFLKHYNSTPFDYDDDHLKDDLRKRGEKMDNLEEIKKQISELQSKVNKLENESKEGKKGEKMESKNK